MHEQIHDHIGGKKSNKLSLKYECREVERVNCEYSVQKDQFHTITTKGQPHKLKKTEGPLLD